MALPHNSRESHSQNAEMNNQLIEILPNQLHDLRLLNDIADVLTKQTQHLINGQALQEYYDQISFITEKQQQRFEVIDRLMKEQYLGAKKGIAVNDRFLVLCKEVRKTEAGIRTVKLFLHDVVNMYNPEYHLVNRINDRIQYFYKRSKELEKEIALLQVGVH